MADSSSTDSHSTPRIRSPRYPFIDLQEAVKRAKVFYDKAKMSPINVAVVVKWWGYNEKSSGGKQTVAALIAYGLVKDQGQKDRRTIRLTDDARRIMLDSSDSPQRALLLKKAALLPTINKAIWDRHDGHLPTDDALEHYLTFDHEPQFNENAVKDFIRDFRSTLKFANLEDGGNVSNDDGDKGTDGEESPAPIAVGDFVQWESQGTYHFEVPKRVRALSDDGKWAFVEGSETGMPVDQLTVQDPPKNDQRKPPTMPLGEQLPPMRDGLGLRLLDADGNPLARQDVFSIPEGQITVQWPASISEESYEDIAAWLPILTRKIGRAVKKDTGEKE